ncbi:MAG: ABC transporter ATP-binding protein [Butyrivibrio sp.]|jgi:ATP-binding cassette subfamily B protein|uniref:ABC transporter ATP-binding protein n=1 Tax=Butyrivibrio sp. TaxID=28121 RepID=UPI001ECE8F2B|nr:ABC transporter ATP-binding protein [Butyrivibrio sp.]MBE5841673.1 ABC transporter ATP-binding protein [Butyrivibrio sp.]
MKKTRFKNKSSIVLYFLKGSAIFFVLAILVSFCVTFLELIGPKIVQYTIDNCISGAAATNSGSVPDYILFLMEKLGGKEYLSTHLYLMALLVAFIAILTAIFRYLFRVINSIAAEKLIKRMRDKLFEHIMHLPFTWHGENHTGDIIQRCTSDVDTIKMFISEQLLSLFRIIIRIAVAMHFMIRINGELTIASAVFIPIIVLYSCFFHNRISTGFEKADNEEGRLSATAQENLTGVRVVRAFGREAYERERFEKQNYEYTNLWISLMKTLAAFWASNDFISGFQVMLITVLGAVYCVNGVITVGEYIAFVFYNSMLTWPVRALGRIISEMSKAGVSIDRLRYIMNSEVEKDVAEAKEPPMDQDITFENVSFVYDNGSEEVLDNVSFKIKAGTTFGILGGTGSGKSTLMYLMDRLYDLPEDGGRILVGDTDIKEIKRSHLRENVGFVLQEPFLFSRTLSENIGITQKEKNEKEIREAARIAALDETIESFGQGYETYVGERGVTLSGGQKQRTAIAQMLVSNPPIMVFDDSLSAVDTQTDAKIRKALSENKGNSTVIIISHRITTLMQADNILVLDHGKTSEIGSHEELLNNNGIYKRIFDIQMQGT